ncbi:MAG: thioredoxin family protein [Flavobacteriaceae bacterium]|nr:thioredoxin family protein [Flavobacteriaceae bacterium]
MKTKIILTLFAFASITSLLSFYTLKEKHNTSEGDATYKVIFYELGSVKCIPCQKMQPVLKSIEEKYGDQVQVVFYDVWTKEGKESAKKFDFDLIPTQIFTDAKGVEFFRHEGYFPEEEVINVLKTKGVK